MSRLAESSTGAGLPTAQQLPLAPHRGSGSLAMLIVIKGRHRRSLQSSVTDLYGSAHLLLAGCPRSHLRSFGGASGADLAPVKS